MVVYTVNYTFQNIASGFNNTNFTTGTTYINSINSNTITTNNINVKNGIINLNPTLLNNMQVGYREVFTGALITCVTNQTSNLSPAPTVPAGTWLISSSHQFTVNTATAVTITFLSYLISDNAVNGVNGNPSYIINRSSNTITQYNYLTYNNSYVLSLTGSSNGLYAPIAPTYTGGTLSVAIVITATRLA